MTKRLECYSCLNGIPNTLYRFRASVEANRAAWRVFKQRVQKAILEAEDDSERQYIRAVASLHDITLYRPYLRDFCEECASQYMTIAPLESKCWNCDRTMRGVWMSPYVTCSERCRSARNYRKVRHDPQPCAHCDTEFTPKRSDAKYCSTRCRVYAHRHA